MTTHVASTPMQFDFSVNAASDISQYDEPIIGFRTEIIDVYADTEEDDHTGSLSHRKENKMFDGHSNITNQGIQR